MYSNSLSEFDELNKEWDEWDDGYNADSEIMCNAICTKSVHDTNDCFVETNAYKQLCGINESVQVPDVSSLTISTKSKEIKLNIPVDLNIFWNIELVSYDSFESGIIKKQRRIKCEKVSDYEMYLSNKLRGQKIKGCNYIQEFITKQMDVQKGDRHLFTHVSMISFGISSKDILKNIKQAFMNCIVLIIRLKTSDWDSNVIKGDDADLFHEYHVKLFNTGKITFAGVKNDIILQKLFNIVIDMLKIYQPIQFELCSTDVNEYQATLVIVNSNFKCNFCIDQHTLRKIFTVKYNRPCIYNSGNQYTGLRCKYYYDLNKSVEEQTGLYAHINGPDVALAKTSGPKNRTDKILKYPKNIVRISYAIFRTGSVLIAGKCNDDILNVVYKHITKILHDEFPYIYMGPQEIKLEKNKTKCKKHSIMY